MITYYLKEHSQVGYASPVKNTPVSQKNRPNNFFILFILALIAIGVVMLAKRGFKDVVEYNDEGNARLTPEREAEIEQAKDRLDQAEVYLLIAIYDHYIECPLCHDGRLWITEGEIAKIGTTVNTTSRYDKAFYKKHGVEYITYIRGSIELVLKTEIELLGKYPLMPENLAREHPLLFPPLNSKLK